MTGLETVLAGLWLMLPTLIPNSAAVLFGGGPPIDLGKSWRGRRILGDGKTWRGFFGGSFAGMAFGLVQIGVTEDLGVTDTWGFGSMPWSVVVVICLAFGAMIGDSIGSFIKRRLGFERGHKAPGLDQFNFVIGAFIVVLIFQPLWFAKHYVEGDGIYALVVFLIVVPILHRISNIIGYKLGKKDVPW
jgi:CDP-2,3-bis-(O-geranylgeranyl)-sn-glycerol synthase